LKDNQQIGRQRNISFYSDAVEVDDWATKQIEDGIYPNRSALVVDAVRCLRHVHSYYGDWRYMQIQPIWVDKIMERLKNVRLDDTQSVEEKEAIIGDVLNLKDDFR
jgi:Arc/MetJ-type ribon-helix-helix transcriptional regulator